MPRVALSVAVFLTAALDPAGALGQQSLSPSPSPSPAMPAPAPAQRGEVAAQGGLSDGEVSTRLQWIQRELDRGNTWANAWYWGWVGIQGALIVGQSVWAGVAAAQGDTSVRNGQLVGVGTGVVGLAPMVIFPFRAAFAAGRVRALPERTPEERRRKLQQSEEILRGAAEGEAFGRSWVVHVLGFAVAGASSAILLFALDRPVNALTSFLLNAGGNEIQIWTQPMAAYDAWQVYQRATRTGGSLAYLRPRAAPPTLHIGLLPSGGIALSGSF
uniref:Uncharacterized protein n=1 Tax=Byssovorax cruenta TaxID=293647 RepID=A0A3S7UZA5_9BACT|nr:hypothetical protein [Byssovorax cruenta]